MGLTAQEAEVRNSTTAAPERTGTVLPDLEEDLEDQIAGGYIVIVYNNDYNTVDQVVLILQKATGCSLEEATMETWEVHNLGKSVVHHGDEVECRRVAGIIATIGIRVEVRQE
jgi:ATP-dependent Clp protease adapter protein ClpS